MTMWIRLAFVGLVGVGFGVLVGWLAFKDGKPPIPNVHEDEATPVAESSESGQPPASPTETPLSADLYADVEDFRSTWEDALDEPGFRLAVERLGEVARAWAEEDPLAAIAAAADGGDLFGVAIQSEALIAWTEADSTGATAWLSQQEPSPNLRYQALAVMMGLVSDSVAGAISRLEAMPNGVREHAEQGLAQALLTPSAAFGSGDFDRVLDWYSTLEPDNDLTMMLSLALAEREPERALAWARSLDDGLRRAAIQGAFISLAADDRELARRLVGEMDGQDRLEAAKTVLHAEVDDTPGTALAWALSFESETERIELVTSVFHSWCSENPDAAVDELLKLPPGKMRDEVAKSSAITVLFDRVDLSERLFKAIESQESRRLVGTVLHERFNRIDPDPEKAAFYREELSKL